MKIGSNIKYLRQQSKFTQEELAKQLGVTCQAVSKWETESNTPDIALLPQIAALFDVSIDTLFSDNVSGCHETYEEIKDDDVIRVVQMRGKQILKVTPMISQDNPPIEIAFPRNCNDKTQYFKVEVFGSVFADGSINGDVICHQSIACATINGCDVHADGNIKVSEINSSGKLVCNNISNCYQLQCNNIECTGNVNSANLTCGQIIYKKADN